MVRQGGGRGGVQGSMLITQRWVPSAFNSSRADPPRLVVGAKRSSLESGVRGAGGRGLLLVVSCGAALAASCFCGPGLAGLFSTVVLACGSASDPFAVAVSSFFWPAALVDAVLAAGTLFSSGPAPASSSGAGRAGLCEATGVAGRLSSSVWGSGLSSVRPEGELVRPSVATAAKWAVAKPAGIARS